MTVSHSHVFDDGAIRWRRDFRVFTATAFILCMSAVSPARANVVINEVSAATTDRLLCWSEDGKGQPLLNMTSEKPHEMLEYLRNMQEAGFMVCAWNGLGFDLKMIRACVAVRGVVSG